MSLWQEYYDPAVSIDLALPRVPLPYFLERAAQRYGARAAISYCGGHEMTYAQLRTHATAIAATLQQCGIGKGSRVLLILPNIPPFVAAYYGTLMAGAVAVPARAQGSDAEIESLVQQVQPDAVITLRMFLPLIDRLQERGAFRCVILCHIREYLKIFQSLLFPLLSGRLGSVGVDTSGRSNLFWYQDIVAAPLKSPLTGSPATDDLAAIHYTSGTTGPPKGVMLTHRNLVANMLQLRAWYPDAREGHEVILTVLPLSHLYAVTACMNLAISMGATIALLPTFDVSEVLRTARALKPTLFPATPAIYVALTEHSDVKKAGLHGIRACISGSTPLPVEVKEAFERLTRGRLVEGYGLTEASPVTHANPLHRHKTGTIGVPLPGTQARVVDRDTRELLPHGEVGELEIAGPQVMAGYWNQPELTERALKDGWLRTGDLASQDEEGYFQLVCRTGEAIDLPDGRTVYPRDIEEVLYEHPQILEAAVVGLPRRGETPLIKAFVVPRRISGVRPQEILAFCQGRLSAYKVPHEVEVRGPLPRNPEGKLLYRLLQSSHEQERSVLGE